MLAVLIIGACFLQLLATFGLLTAPCRRKRCCVAGIRAGHSKHAYFVCNASRVHGCCLYPDSAIVLKLLHGTCALCCMLVRVSAHVCATSVLQNPACCVWLWGLVVGCFSARGVFPVLHGEDTICLVGLRLASVRLLPVASSSVWHALLCVWWWLGIPFIA